MLRQIQWNGRSDRFRREKQKIPMPACPELVVRNSLRIGIVQVAVPQHHDPGIAQTAEEPENVEGLFVGDRAFELHDRTITANGLPAAQEDVRDPQRRI